MTDIENKVDRLDERVTKVENHVSELTANLNNLIRELKDFKDEMRQQNQMRAEEIREMRQDMKNMQKSLDAKIDGIGNHVRNLAITSMAAIGAMVVTVIISLLKN